MEAGHQCPQCSSRFKHKKDLKRHQRTLHGGLSFPCGKRGAIFKRKDNLQRHMKKHEKENVEKQRKVSVPAPKVNQEGGTINEVQQREGTSAPNASGVRGGDGRVQNVVDDETSALNGNLKVYKLNPRVNEQHNLSYFLSQKSNAIIRILERELKEKHGLKFYICVKVQMVKYRPNKENEICQPHFRSNTTRTVHSHELREQLRQAKEKVRESFIEVQRNGSGWQLDMILHMDVCVASYTPIRASSYVKLPKKIQDKKAVLNIQNYDNKCFVWSVLAVLHPC